MQFTIQAVYYTEAPMNPIAINVKVNPGIISWEDTSHGRALSYAQLLFDGQQVQAAPNNIPKEIIIIPKNQEDEKNKEKKSYITLHHLTKKIFDDKLKDRVAGGKKLNFANDQEVQEYYLKTDFYSG